RRAGRSCSSEAADELHVDQSAQPHAERCDQRDIEVDAAMEPFGEAEQNKRDRRPAELETDERVDRPRPHDEDARQDEHREQCRCRDQKGVHTGDSDCRCTTRSWTSTSRVSAFMSTTYAFGLIVASTARHARSPAARGSSPTEADRRTTNVPPVCLPVSRRTSSRETMPKSIAICSGTRLAS